MIATICADVFLAVAVLLLGWATLTGRWYGGVGK